MVIKFKFNPPPPPKKKKSDTITDNYITFTPTHNNILFNIQ